MSVSVLFVCLGNICRSPLAEAALRAEADRANLPVEVDSAGTGDWHVDCPPDERAQAVALRNGIDISHYRGRQVTPQDFHRFDHIFALDAENLKTSAASARRTAPPTSASSWTSSPAAKAPASPTPISARTKASTKPGQM